MFQFCCSGKQKQSKTDLDSLTILEDFHQKSFETSQLLQTAQWSMNIKIGKSILNMQVSQDKITFSNPSQKGNASNKQKAKVLNLNKENLTFSIIYDVSYQKKNRRPIGIKFVDYNKTIQQQYNKQKNRKQQSVQKNTATTISNEQSDNSNKQKISNLNLIDDQYPSVTVYFEENIQHFSENLFEFLSQKIHQSDFRSIYKTIQVLGEGSSGTVFNVINRDTFQQYAAKVISKAQLIKEPNAYEAIKQEISLMKEVDSDMLIKVHQVLEDSEYFYLIIDLFNGGTLQSKLDQKNIEYNINEIQTIMKQLLQGVQDLHSLKIMHRDIKPENILFKSNSSLQLVICDLGLATKWDIPKYLFQNVGTPGYVAPEVYNEKGQYDGICDIYSCGIILYQLLFHRLPFKGDCIDEIFDQNKESKIDFHDILVQNKVQKAGVSLLKKMLEKDPELRISSLDCLQHKFFSLTIDDQKKFDQQLPLKIDLDINLLIKKEKQKQILYKKTLRDKIKKKYNFIIPNTPIIGKLAQEVQDFNDQTILSLDYEQKQENQKDFLSQASNQNTPKNDSLLKKTLNRNIKNDQSPQSYSSQNSPESFQLYQNLQCQQKKITDAPFILHPQIKIQDEGLKEQISKSQYVGYEIYQQNQLIQLNQHNSAKCKRRSLFGQISPSNTKQKPNNKYDGQIIFQHLNKKLQLEV